MTAQTQAVTADFSSSGPRMTRGISFAGHLHADIREEASSVALGPNRRMSHTGSIQVRMPVQPMADRKKRATFTFCPSPFSSTRLLVGGFNSNVS
jgi:hypothetical protein